MRGLFLILLAVVISTPVVAETTISLSKSDCARLVRHEPAPDVAYKPGADARGRAVAPADLGSNPSVKIPDRFEFPITVDLGERLGIPAGGDADYIARVPVGAVSVTPDGRVSFNGVALTDDEAAQLSELCQKRGAER